MDHVKTSIRSRKGSEWGDGVSLDLGSLAL